MKLQSHGILGNKIDNQSKKELEKDKNLLKPTLLKFELFLTIVTSFASCYIITNNNDETTIIKNIAFFSTIIPIIVKYLWKTTFYKKLCQNETNMVFKSLHKFFYFLNFFGFICTFGVALFLNKTNFSLDLNFLPQNGKYFIMGYYLLFVFLGVYDKLVWSNLDLTYPINEKENKS